MNKRFLCNKCHNTILRQSHVTCLTCDKTMKKNVDIEILHGQILLTGKQDTTNAENKTEQTVIYVIAATYNSNQNVHVCVATQMCRKIYVKCTTK